MGGHSKETTIADQGFYTATNLPSDGTTIDAADVNTDLQGLIDEFNKNVGESKITDGAVSAAKIKGEAWTNFSPSWTNLSVGNGTVVAKYIRFGKTIHFYINLIFGTTTSVTGSVYVTPPVNFSSTLPIRTPIAICGYDDNATEHYHGRGRVADDSTQRIQLIADNASGTYEKTNAVAGTAPHTWAVNDRITITGTYEGA